MPRLRRIRDNLFRALFYALSEEAAVRHFARQAFLQGLGREPVLDPATATFNDKIYWRKVFDRNPLFPRYSDKILVKDIVRQVVGAKYVTPTLWHGTDMSDLRRFLGQMHEPYVVKCNHGAGWNVFVRDPAKEKVHRVVRKIGGWLRQVYGRRRGEPAYFRVRPQVLVEPHLSMGGVVPVDYKLFVFDGVVHYIEVDFGRGVNHTRAFFDRNWRRQPFIRSHPDYDGPTPRPVAFDEMLAIAEKVAAPFDFARVDLYDIGGAPRFGEVTFYPDGGTGAFVPEDYDRIFGRLWAAPVPPRPSAAGGRPVSALRDRP